MLLSSSTRLRRKQCIFTSLQLLHSFSYFTQNVKWFIDQLIISQINLIWNDRLQTNIWRFQFQCEDLMLLSFEWFSHTFTEVTFWLLLVTEYLYCVVLVLYCSKVSEYFLQRCQESIMYLYQTFGPQFIFLFIPTIVSLLETCSHVKLLSTEAQRDKWRDLWVWSMLFLFCVYDFV